MARSVQTLIYCAFVYSIISSAVDTGPAVSRNSNESFDKVPSATFSSPPTLHECLVLAGTSPGKATEGSDWQRCSLLPSFLPLNGTSLEPTEALGDGVQAITEAVLEVLPSAQQNFALDKDGAKVLASNPGAKKVAAMLDDDSDTFMRNDCRDDKWVVVELSQVAKASRVELAQYELYSSRVKDFEIRGRQSHPRTDNVETSKWLNSSAWKLVGKWTAEYAKGTQEFAVEHPAWVRYLLVRFLSHYGSEPVCAVNGIAIYGKSATEELEDQLAGDTMDLDPLDQSGQRRMAESTPPGPARSSSTDQEIPGKASVKDEASSHDLKASTVEKPDGWTELKVDGPSSLTEQPTSAEESIGRQHDADKKEAGEIGLLEGSQFANSTVPSSDEGQAVGEEFGAEVHKNQSAASSSQIPGSGKETSPAVESGHTVDNRHLHIANDVRESAAAEKPLESGDGNIPIGSLEEMPVPKAKSGSGVYDVLVQEIRAARAQQRVTAKVVEALQRNLTALASALARVGPQVSEGTALDAEETLKQIEAVVNARLGGVHLEMMSLQRALTKAAKREQATWALLAMLCGGLILSLPAMGAPRWKQLRRVVAAISAANGAVGLALHLQSAALGRWPSQWLPALPGPS